ncbi:MAG: ATP synthase F0 subunit B [Deltaproteobacteria bacterium]|jgi:F-type H+-transporting ATPase subunit b|nr:ATP synthase F0 subunit B [Deltaproteobacteria bacterium]
MQIISNIALISINETLIVQMISFLIFLFIINRIMVRPLRRVMDERKSHIDRIQQDIENARSEYERLTDQIQTRENEVRNEASEQRLQLTAKGKQQASEIMASTREEINAMMIEAEKEVDYRIATARKHVQMEAENLSKQIIAAVLHRSQKS